VTIIGHQQNRHTALVNIKNLIETTYGYGVDYFMPLIADPFNSNTIDVYTYYGIWMKYVQGSNIKKILIRDLGCNYSAGSVGNGNRTQSIAMGIYNSKQLSLSNIITTQICSEIKAAGLQIDNAYSIDISHSDFSYNQSMKRAV